MNSGRPTSRNTSTNSRSLFFLSNMTLRLAIAALLIAGLFAYCPPTMAASRCPGPALASWENARCQGTPRIECSSDYSPSNLCTVLSKANGSSYTSCDYDGTGKGYVTDTFFPSPNCTGRYTRVTKNIVGQCKTRSDGLTSYMTLCSTDSPIPATTGPTVRKPFPGPAAPKPELCPNNNLTACASPLNQIIYFNNNCQNDPANPPSNMDQKMWPNVCYEQSGENRMFVCKDGLLTLNVFQFGCDSQPYEQYILPLRAGFSGCLPGVPGWGTSARAYCAL